MIEFKKTTRKLRVLTSHKDFEKIIMINETQKVENLIEYIADQLDIKYSEEYALINIDTSKIIFQIYSFSLKFNFFRCFFG